MKSLGETLKDAREIMSLTLREVEEATLISNAYLSQLENDKIKKPSASILYKLAEVYGIKLETLLHAAGIIKTDSSDTPKLLNTVALSAKKLTTDEEEELLKYLRFIRSEKKKK